ncbi:hypothetical protein D3C72_2349110 [compost metagenome]
MMLPIAVEEASIASMADTACLTISPECSAPFFIRSTSRPASPARRVESPTVVVISSSEAAVSSSEAACRSVRLARSSAACRISSLPLLI